MQKTRTSVGLSVGLVSLGGGPMKGLPGAGQGLPRPTWSCWVPPAAVVAHPDVG